MQKRSAVSTTDSTNSQLSNSSSLKGKLSNIATTSRGVDRGPWMYSRFDHTLVISLALRSELIVANSTIGATPVFRTISRSISRNSDRRA